MSPRNDPRTERTLRPLSGGRITRSAKLLWQSYWWFVPTLLLLIAE